ncbi:MAG: NAD(P)-dependent oxidoreductase [Terracidiphilus sp.]|nr:NAD(P)-dependent oxidoreductase [Terracidiphilus sp.]
MKIAFLGLGAMGVPMVRRLAGAGHDVTVWNRSRARAAALTGVTVAETAAEAVRGAEAVLTSLFDDTAHEEVLLGASGVLDAMERGALHVSLSTISVALSERLETEHARRGLRYVAAPVFGRPNVAEAAKLWIVVAGSDEDVALARPLLEPLSRGISVVGTAPRQAHALKIGGNFLISTMIYSLSEAFVFAQAEGIDPAAFLEAVNSALFQSPFYAAYSGVMLNPPEVKRATIALGVKDLNLFRTAAEARGVELALAEHLAGVLAAAQQAGWSTEDWAAGIYKTAQALAGKKN